MVAAANNNGFSLVEILMATIVMTMMMVSVIGYVSTASEIWQKGYEKISAINYERGIIEVLKADMLSTPEIITPTVGETPAPDFLHYKIQTEFGLKAFKLLVSDDAKLKREFQPDAADSVISDQVRSHYDLTIARNVKSFSINRISTWTIEIFIEIGTDPDENENRATVSSNTTVLLAPAAG